VGRATVSGYRLVQCTGRGRWSLQRGRDKLEKRAYSARLEKAAECWYWWSSSEGYSKRWTLIPINFKRGVEGSAVLRLN
jgi:hypothetical protein